MSFQKPEKDFGEGPVCLLSPGQHNSRKPHQLLIVTLQKIHKIRITLSSRKVASLEKVCQELIERAKSKSLTVKGPGQYHSANQNFEVHNV